MLYKLELRISLYKKIYIIYTIKSNFIKTDCFNPNLNWNQILMLNKL